MPVDDASTGSPVGADQLTIRRSSARDSEALARLAELDTAPPPSGPYLLAEEGGELRAALSLAGGPSIGDPFRRTVELIALLELRSAQLAAPPAGAARGAGGFGGRAPRRWPTPGWPLRASPRAGNFPAPRAGEDGAAL